MGAFDGTNGARPRVLPHQVAGARPHGVRGWVAEVRRRGMRRLRGEQDVAGFVRQGLKLGRDVYVARGLYLDPGFAWLIEIGDESTLGPNLTVLTHDATPKLRTGHSAIAPVRVGARVFIGANATILPGVTNGEDAIVGAGSVVRRDVPAGTVVFGNPAEEHGTTARHIQRHEARLGERPRFGDTALATPEGRARALAELEEGPGYIA